MLHILFEYYDFNANSDHSSLNADVHDTNFSIETATAILISIEFYWIFMKMQVLRLWKMDKKLKKWQQIKRILRNFKVLIKMLKKNW